MIKKVAKKESIKRNNLMSDNISTCSRDSNISKSSGNSNTFKNRLNRSVGDIDEDKKKNIFRNNKKLNLNFDRIRSIMEDREKKIEYAQDKTHKDPFPKSTYQTDYIPIYLSDALIYRTDENLLRRANNRPASAVNSNSHKADPSPMSVKRDSDRCSVRSISSRLEKKSNGSVKSNKKKRFSLKTNSKKHDPLQRSVDRRDSMRSKSRNLDSNPYDPDFKAMHIQTCPTEPEEIMVEDSHIYEFAKVRNGHDVEPLRPENHFNNHSLLYEKVGGQPNISNVRNNLKNYQKRLESEVVTEPNEDYTKSKDNVNRV